MNSAPVFTIRPHSIRMKSLTATVDLAGRTVTVRELTMQEIRHLLGLLDLQEIAARDSAASVDADAAAPAQAPPPEPDTAESLHAMLFSECVAIDGVSIAHVRGMTDIADADFPLARPSELGELVAKIKQLNPFFFVLLGRLRQSQGSSSETSAPLPESPAPN